MNDTNGYAVFFFPQALEALGEAGRELFFVFTDGMSGHGSYPAGRFLEAAWPEADGKVVLVP